MVVDKVDGEVDATVYIYNMVVAVALNNESFDNRRKVVESKGYCVTQRVTQKQEATCRYYELINCRLLSKNFWAVRLGAVVESAVTVMYVVKQETIGQSDRRSDNNL
jgi:hypothetical protein